jgi:TonB family protein
MENFMIIIIRSTLILTACVILYQLIRKDKNFTRNRIFLVGGMFASMLFPFINFSIAGTTALPGIRYELQQVIITPGTIEKAGTQHPTLMNIIAIIYILGIFLMLGRFLLQLFQIYRIMRHSGKSVHAHKMSIYTSEQVGAFSFFRLIFISSDLRKPALSPVLRHEAAHARQLHSLDVMIFELLACLHWFNPLIPLYRRMIRENHEFLADRSVLESGIEKAGYMELLLNMNTNSIPAGPGNNFCQIKIKRRIQMITRSNNPNLAWLRSTVVFSVFMIGLTLVSCNFSSDNKEPKADSIAAPKVTKPDANSGSQTIEGSGNAQGNSDVYTVVEDMPTYRGGDDARIKFLVSNIKYPEKARENGIQGTVYVSFVIDEVGTVTDVKVLRGIGNGCDEEAMRVVRLMPRWNPGKQSGKPVKVQFNMPIKFTLAD